MALRRRASILMRAFKPHVVHSLHLYSFGAIADRREPVLVTAYGLEVDAVPPVIGSVSVSQAVHAVSRFTGELVRTRVSPTRPIEILTWGVRSVVPREPQPCEFDVITVSRLVRRKNVDTVLRAIRTIGNLRYAVVGDGPEIGRLRELSLSLGLTKVAFFGAVDDERRRELLARSGLFVMCPRHEERDVEGLGLVYFEAFESGLPVVASDRGGVPDAVGSAGILVDDPEDVDKVAAAIRLALEGPTRTDLCARVRERQKTHSWDSFLERFEHLYRRLRNC